MSKFAAIKSAGTNGVNYDVGNDDIVNKLEAWDAQYGIEVSEISQDSVKVTFNALPDDVAGLAKEIYEFCPDVIDQGFGVMDEMVEMMEESGQPLDPAVAELVEGVDFDDDDFGEVLLQRSLSSTRAVTLWWD